MRKNSILKSETNQANFFLFHFNIFNQFETTPWNSLSHYKSSIYIWYLIKASCCCCCYSEKSDRPTRIGPRKNVRYVWKAADEVLGLRMRLMGITNSLGPVSWLILNNFFSPGRRTNQEQLLYISNFCKGPRIFHKGHTYVSIWPALKTAKHYMEAAPL